MSTSGGSTIFSGTSRYSSDFQQIIDRAVAIAFLPKSQMENTKSTLSAQSTALGTLDAKFEALQNSIASLGAARASYSTSTSDGSVASASVSDGALAGVYQIEVVNLGSYTSSMSIDGLSQVADPYKESVSTSASFTLTVNGDEYTIAPSGSSLVELAEAINASGAAVEATIVNIGSPTAPDFRLSLRSTALGAVAIQLNDGSTDLLDTISTGTLAEYRVNGQPASVITSDSRTVTIAPHLTANLLKEGTTQVTVSHNLASVTNAFSSLVSAYNAAVDELDKHRGKDAGALAGSSLVHTLSRSLRDLVTYDSGTGGISSLTSLGLEYDDKGKLSLDMTAFSAATTGQWEALNAFLGQSDGDGFLKYATDVMNGLENSTDGVIETAISSLKDQISWQETRIEQEQDRIDQLEENLIARMSAADALIASLEQQVTYITGLFESMRSLRENQ
ncbi:MAG: flagellar filament capping protein FliD [Bryobacteraceae bacterium]